MTSKVGRFASKAQGSLWVIGSLIASSALAQVSVLTGTVTDAATKQPIGDVVVTATSPALQGEQVVVTDSTGLYRVPQLPPGTYSIRLEKEAYKPYSRSDIDIRADKTVRLNVEMLPESLHEEVIVVGRPPTIDVGSSATSTSVTTDFVRNLALSAPRGRGGAQRSFESLALVAPQAISDLYGISLNGSTSPENSYLIDGVSVNNPAYGILGSPVTAEFFEEVNVVTGGYMPEFGRSTGGVLSAITKSGSNEFHGSIFGFYTPGGLEGEPNVVYNNGSSISATRHIENLGDFGATLGGPIIKDKLWFFAGIQPSFQRYRIERQFYSVETTLTNPARPDLAASYTTVKNPNTGLVQVDQLPQTNSKFYADGKSLQYTGKLTYQLNSDNRFSLSVLGTPSWTGGNGFLPIDVQTTSTVPRMDVNRFDAAYAKEPTDSIDIIGKWNGSFLDKRFLVDATAGYHFQSWARLPGDGSQWPTPAAGWPGSYGTNGSTTPEVIWNRNSSGTRPGPHSIEEFENLPPIAQLICGNPFAPGAAGALARVTCPVPGSYRTGGFGFVETASLNTWQGNVKFTYLLNALGHHVLKAGVDAQYYDYDHDSGYTGTTILQESGSGNLFLDVRGYSYLVAPNTPNFLLDVRNKTHSVMVGGYVQDSWSIMDVVTANVGVRYDTQSLYGSDNGVLGLTLPNQWSPRLGLVYDFTQQGRSKIYVNFARYYENIPLDALDREFPGQPGLNTASNGRFRTGFATTGAPASRPGCDPHLNPNTCLDPRNVAPPPDLRNIDQYQVYAGDKTPVDPNIKDSNSDELVAGAEYEVFANARAGASYTRRYLNNWIEDMSRDEGATFFLGNPGSGVAADFPKAVRNYNAFTFYFTKAFADLWLAQVSYTYTTLYGNFEGAFRPSTQQLDPNINSDFDLKSLLVNRLGNLNGDGHSIKFFASKEFVLSGTTSFSLGASYTGQQGNPITYEGHHPLYGNGEIFILPRGSAGRTPWIHEIDGRLGYNIRLSKDSVLSLTTDVFNLFNFQKATTVDQNYTFQNVQPVAGGTIADLQNLKNLADGSPFVAQGNLNPNFKNPTAYQAPRSIRFGARLTF